ncbi:MAG: DUF3786 domain-containing protein [Dissulfurispiraceae bacterium]
MNPVEIYKKLPGTNCGKCKQKACMPFAFALLKGEADLSECPGLTDNEKAGMSSSVKKNDWREDLIASLKQEIRKVDFHAASGNLGAELRDGNLFIRCFGRDVIVGPDGEMRTESSLTPWMRMLVLFYIRNGGGHALSGKWVLHSELIGGLMKYKAFQRECEEPLRELFDRHFEKTSMVLDGYGSAHPGGFATPNAWMLNVFPMLPVVFLYWPADDEFESKVTIRFDSSADKYFDVEQLVFLIEEIVRDIEASI